MPPLLFQLKEVYKLSLFNVNQTVASKARNTSTVPIKDKQFLIVTDSGVTTSCADLTVREVLLREGIWRSLEI